MQDIYRKILNIMKNFISGIEQAGFEYNKDLSKTNESTPWEAFRMGQGRPVVVGLCTPIFRGPNYNGPVEGDVVDNVSKDTVEMYDCNIDDKKIDVEATKGIADLKNVSLNNNARLKVKTNNNTVYLTNLKTNGAFPQTQPDKSRINTISSVNNTDVVKINGANFKQTDSYNGIEIGLAEGELPSLIDINDCNFEGKFNNNVILIFGTKDNAVINIRNCHFKDVSNCIRFSNKTNAKNVVVNISNCTCDKWEATPEYAGFFMCQDYTSGSEEAEMTNNLFGDGKITINIDNVTGPDGKQLKDYESIENSTIYVYYNKSGIIKYEGNENRFPTINFK